MNDLPIVIKEFSWLYQYHRELGKVNSIKFIIGTVLKKVKKN